MHRTIKSPGEHYGHLDGSAAAEEGSERYPDRAFDRRQRTSRLHESERADYARAYVEAFDVAVVLKLARVTSTWLVVQ